MPRRGWILSLAARATALLAAMVHSASPADGEVSVREARGQDKTYRPNRLSQYRRRREGRIAYRPDTVTAAETVASLASTLDRTLFPLGSDVAESKIKPEIFSAKDHVDQLIVAVKTATAQLVPVIESADKAAITAAYTAVNNACNGCHTEFRKEE